MSFLFAAMVCSYHLLSLLLLSSFKPLLVHLLVNRLPMNVIFVASIAVLGCMWLICIMLICMLLIACVVQNGTAVVP